MSDNMDMSQYLDLFIQEADEQLEILEQETLKLEDDPSDDRMQVIFRAAHTLKGSSRAMGFANFAELTHEMENVLDRLRSHTLNLSSDIADALLACIDTLGQMASSIGSGNGDAIECSELVSTLQGFQGVQAQPSSATGATTPNSPSGWESCVPPDQWQTLDEASSSATVLHGIFRITPDCVMKYVRAVMAVSIAQENGEVLVTVPNSEELEEEKFDTVFEIVFSTSEQCDTLKEKFEQISEIAGVRLEPWSSAFVAESKKKQPAAQVTTQPADGARAVVQDNGAKKTEANQTVRVDVARLDNLMNLVGELVIDRTRIAQIGNELSQKYDDQNVDELEVTVGHIARITSDLQDQIMKARMMPIETVFNRFPRVVRDIAKKLNKEVNLELVGGETELDRSVIELIGDPLLHILRNSVDHGLETPDDREKVGKSRTGNVVVAAKHQENHIVIEITDDGKGIDADRIKAKAIENGLVTQEAADRLSDKEILQFIFASGLSTASEVSEVSGRGVGMDIVRSNIQKVGGIIDLESTPGKGTKFSLRLPLTLAIIRGLMVNVRENAYVLPLGSVVETLLIEEDTIQTVNKREVIVIRGVTTPLIHMDKVFWPGSKRSDQDVNGRRQIFVVIVGIAEQRVGMVVDGLIGEQEVVIKSLSRYCGETKGVSGATILGDGNVALIVDVNGVMAAA